MIIKLDNLNFMNSRALWVPRSAKALKSPPAAIEGIPPLIQRQLLPRSFQHPPVDYLFRQRPFMRNKCLHLIRSLRSTTHMMVMSEILRFPLLQSPSSSSAFQKLRDQVSSQGQVKTQYFGYVVPNQGFPLPKSENEMCWVIRAFLLRNHLVLVSSD